MRLSLKTFDGLDKAGKAAAIAELVSDLDLGQSENPRMRILAQLQKFKAAHKISSADMFDSADCEKRELDPELDEWATLYRCYKEIA
jgi:hypothetical protein